MRRQCILRRTACCGCGSSWCLPDGPWMRIFGCDGDYIVMNEWLIQVMGQWFVANSMEVVASLCMQFWSWIRVPHVLAACGVFGRVRKRRAVSLRN